MTNTSITTAGVIDWSLNINDYLEAIPTFWLGRGKMQGKVSGFCDYEIYEHAKTLEPTTSSTTNSEGYSKELKEFAADWFLSQMTFFINLNWHLDYLGPKQGEQGMFESETNIFARWKAIDSDVQLGYWTDGENYWFIGADSTHFFAISCLESHPQIKSELVFFDNSDGSTWTSEANAEILTEEILRHTNPDQLIRSFKKIAWNYIANQKH